MDQEYLIDANLYKRITSCFIRKKHPSAYEIFVIYTDGTRETIWTYNPLRFEFVHSEFIGKTKIAAVFYCDRKEPRGIQLH